MRHTGIAISALAVALTCGTGAAFAQYGHAPQQEYRQAQDQRQDQYRNGEDRRDANSGYGVDRGYATQYVRPGSGYGSGYGFGNGENGARNYRENQRLRTYYNRHDEDRRFRQDDWRRERRDEDSYRR